MGLSGPTARRRNHAWLQMRGLRRRATRLTRRQEDDDDGDAANDADSSGDESVDSVDTSDDESGTEPTTTVRPLLASMPVRLGTGKGVIPLPKPTATAGADVATGVTLGAAEPGEVDDSGFESESDGVESNEDEPGHRPDGHPNKGRPPPPSSTITQSSAAPSITSVSATATTTSLDNLVSSLAGTATPSPTVPVAGGAQFEEGVLDPGREANEQASDSVSVGTEMQSKLSSAALAGIVLGALAFAGLLVGAAIIWRKRRRDGGFPFFPQTRFRLNDDDESHAPSSHAPSVTGPLPGEVGGKNQAKTNTQIMDDLMRAAYATDKGSNDMEGAYAPAVPKPTPQLSQQQHEEAAVFMDEKAYAALQRPQTPGSPKEPVMDWLHEVKTPTQPNGPEMPPTPETPSTAAMPRLMHGGRVPEPPKPAYHGRDTMTTDTTNTSVRWYG
ncbi:hypothetical protein N657DRAFT_260911 [Parathielavia appendiculata]|uniref:Uncharacterized protein n=1 Tax=Parathielavia appendiculata TaxID=2587402 RepID=A0AAN6TRV7_9PEZI|nr:hypothetical protein N657DRAFT_260911 [Parathielavia appendiculata]